MKHLQNLHTHSIFCDGADTPEEMVQTALEKRFDSIGFSSHSSMSPERALAYRAEVERVREKYQGLLPIYLGMEVDLLDPADLNGFDYLIGAAHYLEVGGRRIGVDSAWEKLYPAFQECFSGDGMAYAKAYYQQLARLPERGDFDIIAHFDLLTKYSEKENFFDGDCDQYREYAVRAAESLAGKIPFFEVNTGAIARGYRTTPYPAPFLLKELKRLGFKAVISSDCHKRENLDLCFDMAVQNLLDAGFEEHYVLTSEGFKAFPLKDS